MSWWIFTLNFSKEVYAHSNTNVEGRTGYSAQFIECWLLDRKEEIKRGQSCKSAAVAFNGRLMEISYFENFCRPRFSIPSHHVWNSKILLDIPTKSSRNFQRNWYLQHTENNFEAAALLVYALDVAKKVQNLVLWIFWKFHKCPYMPPPPPNSDAVCAYLSSNCYAVEPFDTTPVFIILSLSAAYARPTLSRTNESILHVTESILAPNKQCSLHFGSRSNPSPLFSSLRLNWVEYLNLSRIRLYMTTQL